MAPQPIRWMHLSDLHMGCRGTEIWWQVRSEFWDSIDQYFRPIDMILLTGDLTFSAQSEQFELLDRFLEELSAGCVRPVRRPTLWSSRFPEIMTWCTSMILRSHLFTI